jgi:hypothetical protein
VVEEREEVQQFHGYGNHMDSAYWLEHQHRMGHIPWMPVQPQDFQGLSVQKH